MSEYKLPLIVIFLISFFQVLYFKIWWQVVTRRGKMRYYADYMRASALYCRKVMNIIKEGRRTNTASSPEVLEEMYKESLDPLNYNKQKDFIGRSDIN